MAAFHQIGGVTIHSWRGSAPTRQAPAVISFVRPGYPGVGSRLVQQMPTPLTIETATYTTIANAPAFELAVIGLLGMTVPVKYSGSVVAVTYLVERADIKGIDYLPRADAFETGGPIAISPAARTTIQWKLLPTS